MWLMADVRGVLSTLAFFKNEPAEDVSAALRV
jgi:hypothetical protein